MFGAVLDSIAVSVFVVTQQIHNNQKQIQISTDGETSRLVYAVQ